MAPKASAPAQGRLRGVSFTLADLVGLRPRGVGLGIPGRRPVTRGHFGAQLSRARGRGMEYIESRPYSPGDDVRYIDWRVTARSGSTHTKLFEAERERPVLIAVDLGESLWFGTRVAFKAVVAAEAAGLLAWAGAARGDRVGAVVAGAAGIRQSRPAPGPRGALGVLRTLVAATHGTGAPATGRLSAALERLARVVRPGTLVLAVSDLDGLDEEAFRHLGRLRARVDVVVCRVRDRLEAAPPPPGRYPIADGAGRDVLTLDRPGTRAAYTHHFATAERRVVDACARIAAPLVRLETDEDPVRGLLLGLAAARVW